MIHDFSVCLKTGSNLVDINHAVSKPYWKCIYLTVLRYSKYSTSLPLIQYARHLDYNLKIKSEIGHWNLIFSKKNLHKKKITIWTSHVFYSRMSNDID